jgi:hypothetical protein
MNRPGESDQRCRAIPQADTFSCVADHNLHMRVDSFEPHLHAPALGRELDRIGKQVPHDLLQAVEVT